MSQTAKAISQRIKHHKERINLGKQKLAHKLLPTSTRRIMAGGPDLKVSVSKGDLKAIKNAIKVSYCYTKADFDIVFTMASCRGNVQIMTELVEGVPSLDINNW